MFSLRPSLRGDNAETEAREANKCEGPRSILRLTYEQGLFVAAHLGTLQISKTSVPPTSCGDVKPLKLAAAADLRIYESEAALQWALFRRLGGRPRDLSEPEWRR